MSGAVVYNEIEPYPAAWLRNLCAANLIAPGRVDERSIADVQADELADAVQFHTFAGIGIWSLALRMAGWPDDRPVWTGSCPCQPFSEAGKGAGFKDERHLWPEWFRLIRECRPEHIFGEQVCSAAGGAWLDLVHADLESVGYTVGAVVLPAASVGAPHIRHRIFFGAKRVGNADELVPGGNTRGGAGAKTQGGGSGFISGNQRDASGTPGSNGGLAHAGQERRLEHGERDGDPAQPREQAPRRDDAGGRDTHGGLGDASRSRLEERPVAAQQRGPLRIQGPATCPPGPLQPWRDLDWLDCSDGKRRPTQPGLFPLAPGYPGRVGQLRASGNAISPQVAATFIRAFLDVEGGC